MKYIFTNIEIEVSSVSIKQVIDLYNGTCIVTAKLTGNGVNYAHVFEERMNYTITWDDADVMTFIQEQLIQFEA
jgi:hypothetical protein